LKPKDIVTAIGGEPVLDRSLSDVRSSLKTAALGKPLTIDYRRGGQDTSVSLVPRELVPGEAR
jgi:S1-C subfamily serine protease